MAYSRAYQRTSEQTISNDILTKLLIDTPASDPLGFFSPAKLGFVIPNGYAGLYVIQVTGYWEGHPTGGTLRQVEIRSGSYPIGGETRPAVARAAMWTSAFCSGAFNVGDVITVHAMQNSGSNLKFRNAAVLIFSP